MILNAWGGPVVSTKSITIAPGNAPLSKAEMRKLNRRKKNDAPIEDSPAYLRKVARERAALAAQQQTKKVDSEESNI